MAVDPAASEASSPPAAWLLDFDWPIAGRSWPAAGQLGPVWRTLDGRRGRCYATGTASPGSDWIGLACLQHLPGASAGAEALFHYTVETDVRPEHEAELNAWYEQEHLPGLAAVPGALRACRYRRLQGSPRYVAAYDLLTPATLERPEWLAVRHTAWSSRVRPWFVAPRRTHFVRADRFDDLVGAR